MGALRIDEPSRSGGGAAAFRTAHATARASILRRPAAPAAGVPGVPEPGEDRP